MRKHRLEVLHFILGVLSTLFVMLAIATMISFVFVLFAWAIGSIGFMVVSESAKMSMYSIFIAAIFVGIYRILDLYIEQRK